MQVTFIGTLPPLKTNVYYCTSLVSELSKSTVVEFLSFKSIYPNFMYPGKKQVDETFNFKFNANVSVTHLISYYNPFSWVLAGLQAKGSIVHAQWWNMWFTPIFFVSFIFALLRKKKTVLTIHNVLPHTTSAARKKINYFFNKLLFNICRHFIVHSETNAAQLNEFYNIPKEKISVIPMGIHDAYVKNNCNAPSIRKEFGINKTAKTILYFGTIKNYKGVNDLIAAFATVSEKYKNAVLIIAGEPWVDWANCGEFISKNNLSDKIITHLKYIPMIDVEKYFSVADLVVLPYKFFDAQSGPGNIALAFGKPLVVTRVGSLPELVKNEVCVVEPGQPEKLANAILKIISDENLLAELSEDSKDLAKTFSWETSATQTIKVYNRLLNADGKPPAKNIAADFPKEK